MEKKMQQGGGPPDKTALLRRRPNKPPLPSAKDATDLRGGSGGRHGRRAMRMWEGKRPHGGESVLQSLHRFGGVREVLPQREAMPRRGRARLWGLGPDLGNRRRLWRQTTCTTGCRACSLL